MNTKKELVSKRFFLKVKFLDDGCWLWTASKTLHGYGTFFCGKNHRAHRFLWQRINGEIKGGLTLDHLCRNRACVNPLHLEPVTQKENVLRGTGLSAMNARKKKCLRGHERWYVNPNTKERDCLECKRIRRREIRRSEKSIAALEAAS